MIVGIGTDLVEIARIERSLSKFGDRFAGKILTPSELKSFQASKTKSHFLAKRFAAKEAAVKALGTGIGRGIGWQQLSVENNELGAPVLNVSGEFAARCEQRGITHWHVSLSDEQHYAVATVILETR